jgi:hypothetical protein
MSKILSSKSCTDPTLDMKIDPKMQGAILNGLYNLSAPIQFSCSTGNCRWDEFTTLAVTSTCKDVTGGTRVQCAREESGDIKCNYTTPAGFFIQGTRPEIPRHGWLTEYNSSARYESSNNSSLVNFALAKMKKPFTLENPDITECEMHWCARIVQNVTVVNGTFSPGIIKDFPLDKIVNPFDPAWWTTYNIANATASFPGNRTFSVSPTDNSAAREFLSGIFSSSIKDSFGLALFNSTNFAETAAMISTSMTYALGQAPSGTQVNGHVISTEQYIQVNWPWIILPLGEVVMGVALLVCTSIHTWRRGIRAWKSSSIIPVLTTMDGWDSRDLRATAWRDLEKRSKHMYGLFGLSEENVPVFKRTDA